MAFVVVAAIAAVGAVAKTVGVTAWPSLPVDPAGWFAT